MRAPSSLPASNHRVRPMDWTAPWSNGEVVRVASAIDTFDREIIAWVATSGGGISGEIMPDMMFDCVKRWL